MRVNEIMSSKVEWISPDLTVGECACRMRDLDVGCLPVGEKDRLVGMITDRDITCRAVADGCEPAKTKVRDVMSKGITYCFDDEDVSAAARIMEAKNMRRLPILNHDKRLVGLVSLSDMSHASHELSGEVIEATSPTHH